MLQVQISEYGGPEVLLPVETPSRHPGEGEVRLQVRAAGVTFVETQLRAGRPPWPGPLPALPLVLGNGVCGSVAAVGPGVDDGLIGSVLASSTGGYGGYASEATVPLSATAGVPTGVSPEAAVSLLADGRTALAVARAASLDPGQRVLVLAAAGGVGHLLVQLARTAGALVVGAASNDAKRQAAADAGAVHTVGYDAHDWESAAGDGGFDAVLDGVGGPAGTAALRLLAPGGRMVSFGAASGTFADASGARPGVMVIRLPELIRSPEDNHDLIRAAFEQAAAGILRPLIGQQVPLHQASDAHAVIEARAVVGKTVLIP